LSFKKPLNANPDRILFFNALKFRENYLNNCKWRQEAQNISIGMQLNSLTGGCHEMKFLTEFRRLFNVQSGASHTIRNESGAQTKSSIIHSWTLSTRDSPVFPTLGHMIKVTNELAGLSGDAQFFKTELNLQHNWTRGLFTLTKSFNIGHSIPIGNDCRVPYFDRFQMGGPTSIRGFSPNSLGPRQFSDALGGTSIIESGIQLSFPVIKSAANFARAHIFFNAGLLGNFTSRLMSTNFKQSLLSDMHPNVSVGGGLMFKMAESARLELNFAVPLVSQEGITPSKGIQIGIGMEFL
jgi:outer membrane protein insertion porin family